MIGSGAFDAVQQFLIRMVNVVELYHTRMAIMSRTDELRRRSILFGTGRVKIVETTAMEIATAVFHRTLKKFPVGLLAEKTRDLNVRLTIGA